MSQSLPDEQFVSGIRESSAEIRPTVLSQTANARRIRPESQSRENPLHLHVARISGTAGGTTEFSSRFLRTMISSFSYKDRSFQRRYGKKGSKISSEGR